VEHYARVEPAVHLLAGLQSPATITQNRRFVRGSRGRSLRYAFVDQSLYAEFGVYHGAPRRVRRQQRQRNNNIIAGVAPYWRVAYEYDWGKNSWEFGTLGMFADLQNPTTPAGNAINASLQGAPTDKFLDAGLDSQYEYIDDDEQFSVDARWIHENQRLDASHAFGFANNSSVSSIASTSTRAISGGASTEARWFLQSQRFARSLYYGNFKGNSNSSWGMAEVDYLPWLNVKLGLQYTAFLNSTVHRRTSERSRTKRVGQQSPFPVLVVCVLTPRACVEGRAS